MEKKVTIGGKEHIFRATAATPMKYRNLFPGKDLFKDLMSLDSGSGDFSDVDMGLFERIAFAMSEDANKGVSLEEWLEGFELMDIMGILPEIMELWDNNLKTQSEPVKNI